LKETYKAYLKHRNFPKPDFSFEDELIARFGKETFKVPKTASG
jgi:hypothetical protein